MTQSDTSEDESGLPTPILLRNNFRSNSVTPISITNSIRSGQIPEGALHVWNQLPTMIRLDPSLAAFQREYDRVNQRTEQEFPNNADRNRVNLPREAYSAISIRVQNYCSDDGKDTQTSQETKQKPLYRYSKLIILCCCWLLFAVVLMFKNEKIETMHQIAVFSEKAKTYQIYEHVASKGIKIIVKGSLLPLITSKHHPNLSTRHLMIWMEFSMDKNCNSDKPCHDNIKNLQNASDVWTLVIPPEYLLGIFPDQKHERIFKIENVDSETLSRGVMFIKLRTNIKSGLPISIAYDLSSMTSMNVRIMYAAFVLIGLYILIIFEIVHRTLAAILASTMSIAILAIVNERPTMTELISWIDMDTLLLLFSMMVLVAVFAETGIFDWMAVYVYRITGGKLWPLIYTLCFFTTLISSFLDNVTTVLLMTPVIIKLCEVMQLNPVPILTAMLVYSNIGGAMTPVGDPPNVIIASNREVIDAGINFITFSLHLSIGVIPVLFIVSVQFRYIFFRNMSVLKFDVPQDVQELRHEIAIWQRAAASLSSYSKDENVVRQTLLKKVRRLLSRLKTRGLTGSVTLKNYRTTLDVLQEKYSIRDKWLLAKSGFVLVFVITLFFLHSVPHINLSLGWIALIGVLLLLILADGEDLDGLMARVEWSTLLFFASLFILMEALSRLGLVDWIGKQTEKIILSVSEENRLAVAILLLLWVSAAASAFIDNVPLTTMMVRIATNLAQNRELGLPLQPLIWSLSLGACMGGNGTLIGATANVICMGVAEQHGYKFSFMQFFKIGFPVMITSTLTITIYLMIAHVIFAWNGS